MSETILQEAERIINGARQDSYGDVTDSFVDIAARWTQELGSKLVEPLTSYDVVHLMVQLKLSRAKNGYHRDSYVDIGGYVGLTEKLYVSTEEEPSEPFLRIWRSLQDMPGGVLAEDKEGDFWRWDSYGVLWWRDNSSDSEWHEALGPIENDNRDFGPFTEVLEPGE